MSLVLNLRAGVDSGFPRLRGDEPCYQLFVQLTSKFSPPPRG